jgi:hypothetical protein
VVPAFTKAKGRDLSIEEVIQHNLETRIMRDPKSPTFYLYYGTVQRDILGKVFLTDLEIIFDPLNERFKGIFGYEYGDILQNHKMGFIVSYKDIVGPPVRLMVQNPEDDSTPEIVAQIGIKHTGN